MYFTEAHFWLFIALTFLLGVLAVIANDFGERSKISKRIERIEQRLDQTKKLEPLQSLKKGKICNDKINLGEEVERVRNSL